MMLEGSNSSTALSWVREDLDETLEKVRRNLETFSENRSAQEVLHTLQDQLEQLNLTFVTMEQRGAVMLTDEMIAVGGNLLHNGDVNVDDSISALSDAVVVLPSYLDRLQAGHDDLPILLLPTLNELRASYDETLLSEGSLFAPDLDVNILEIQGSPDEPVSFEDWPKFARKVRADFQNAFLAWLKEQSNPDLVKPLHGVCEVLVARLERTELRRLWWIASHVMTGLQVGAINNDLPLRRVFARLDLCLKSMAEEGEKGPQKDSIIALSRALLFQVVQAKPGCEAVDLLRERFRLEKIIPDRDALLRAKGAVTGRDAKLFYSIGRAIQEEMATVKDSLDMELRTGHIDGEARTSIVSSLVQLSDTLRMLDLPVAASALEQLLPTLELTREVENFELDSPLLSLAQQLLEVESVLDQHISLLGEPFEASTETSHIALPAHEQRQIVSKMLDEAVTSLHVAQDGIRERLEGDSSVEYVEPLREIAGALQVAQQGEVSKLTDKLERALNAVLLDKDATPEVPEDVVRRLTDAVAALELYLTGCRDQQANSLRFLDIMQQRLEGLPEVNALGEAVSSTVVELPDRKARAESAHEAAVVDPGTEPQDQAGADDRPPPPLDSTMRDIFLEEFEDICSALNDDLAAWLGDARQRKRLEGIRRGFHTLKGSGRMVGAKEVGDFCWRIEQMLNRVLEGKVEQNDNLARTVQLCVAALPSLLDRLLRHDTEMTSGTIKAITDHARELARGGSADVANLRDLLPESTVQAVWGKPSGTEPARADAGPEAPEADAETSQAEAEGTAEADQAQDESKDRAEAAAEPDDDPELKQLVIGEVSGHLDTLQSMIEAFEKGKSPNVTVDHVRAAHSIAGTLSLVPLGDEPDLARALEAYLQSQVWASQKPRAEAAPVLGACLERFGSRITVLEDETSAQNYKLKDANLIEKLEALTRSTKASDRENLEAATAAVIDKVTGKPDGQAETPEKEREIEAGAEDRKADAQAPDATDAQADTEDAGQQAAPEKSEALTDLGSEFLDVFLDEATEVLERCDTHLNAWRDKLSDSKLVKNLQRDIHTFKGGARMAGLESLGNLSHAMETLLESIAANRLPATVAAVQALEEGCDHLTVCVEQLQSGQLPKAENALERFLKKSRELTSEAPEVEAEVAPKASVEEKPEAAPVERAPDEAESDTKAAKTEMPDSPTPDVSAPTETAQDETPVELPEFRRPPPHSTEIDTLDEIKREFHDIDEKTTGAAEEDAPAGSQIRVGADLMDSLVNYSGEISIYRARLEEQLGAVRFNLKEVDQTVARLNDQLRKMAMETEAQMLSRYNSASNKGSSDFDPLELDRFSNIQQLSRALTETVNDLASLHGMLDDSVRQAENLLGQQSRVSTDLQEGLMQTRMTPFAGQAPRFRRVVRAAASETGKSARLQLLAGGSTDRLDRNVLERITAPLEHMLRNAVVHGIESPAERRKAKKPEEGTITVAVSAEATEFVIRVQDDGGGLDLDAIRKRATERGLIGKDEKATPRQLARFILESGFTTSREVTGLAGRGVGMDVVNSEIKQIGGSLEIATEAGKGTRFTVRIPFSLAVMQVIGLSVGGQSYMVPLNSIAGVGRISPAEFTRAMKEKSPTFEFAGEKYPLMELGPLVGIKPDPLGSSALTLLVIDTGEQRAALRISNLKGHQEAVIKPIGPQISSIPGILGGTISGDGKVVIILDIGPLIRHGFARATELLQRSTEPAEDMRPPLVMVTDDSITMRKVTTRVLESHALKVIAAKDGVDAVEKLHECVPDLILLDIEMPRMDGYELAEYVRADSRLKHIPIIMVTSRAGQKHRKRARQTGADGYLTKPYQESELIEQVGEILGMDLARVTK